MTSTTSPPVLTAPTLLAIALLAGLSGARQTATTSDDDLEGLAQSLAFYLEARASATGLEEARLELERGLARLARERGEPPLSSPRDLGRAFWLSFDRDGAELRRGSVTEHVFAQGRFEDGLACAYWIPEDVDPGGPGLPLIVAVPDAGERPAQHLRSHWTLRPLLDGAILVCPEMPANQSEWDRITLDGRPGGLCHVLTALRLACEHLPVDFDRVFVVGRGKGIPAAFAAGNYAPERFAGVAGWAGDAGDVAADNFGNTPTYFAGGGARARAFRDAARRAGFDNCVLDPGGSQADLWTWMEAHPRRPHPGRVHLAVGKPFPTRAYWLRVAPSAPDARATAAIDRAANTVVLDAHGVTHATLYLNDALVDLSRPLSVVCNGERREVSVARNLSRTLDLLHDGTSDPGAVYVASVTIDTAPGAGAAAAAADRARADFDRRLAAAAGDVGALWALHEASAAAGRAAESRRALRHLLRLEPDHRPAREALGQRGSDGLWFRSRAAHERYLAGQRPEEARAKGHVLYDGVWIHPDARALAVQGRVLDAPTGQWLSRADQKRLATGWGRQDLAWIPPAEVHRVDDGLWLAGGAWVSLEEADRRHARLDDMWHVPGPEVLLHSTARREVALRAAEEMARAIADLRRVFGVEPMLPLEVTLLRDEEQYDRFAFGDPDGRRLPTDATGRYIVHSAFFADRLFERSEGELLFRGMGVCYWDELAPHGHLYGTHAARLAVGLSYVEALDPSPKTVRRALARGVWKGYGESYQSEKRLPAWLRYGAAVYAERYFRDETAAPDGDPWWARLWSLENLRARGGLRPLEEVFAFPLDPADREDGLKLLIEAGLVVAFVVDGNCAPVSRAHEKVRRSLAFGRASRADAKALERALAAHEAELRAFAEL